jgi:glycine dehydrogenase subunit 2
MSINQSGWRPTSPEANTGNVPASVTGNKALMLEEALIFEIGDSNSPAMLRPVRPLTQPSPRRGEGYRASTASRAPTQSASPASPSPRPSATTPASRARTTASTSASSRSGRAR